MNFKHLITVAALAATALSTTSCRSTLYRAAERGDMQAVQHELNTGANPDGKASLGNLFWQIPAGLVAVPLDMTRILASLTYVWITIDPMLYLENEELLKGLRADLDTDFFQTLVRELLDTDSTLKLTLTPSVTKAAEDAARRARFNPIDGIDNQTGTITYYFKLR